MVIASDAILRSKTTMYIHITIYNFFSRSSYTPSLHAFYNNWFSSFGVENSNIAKNRQLPASLKYLMNDGVVKLRFLTS